MATPIITVENLGKAYKLGLKEEKYPTFREALVGAAKAPLRRFRHLSDRGGADELFWALKDVSFEVQRGEVVGIIGRNGAGKSTLLKILSRITEPTLGRAVLRGRVASLLEVGTGFHPELTGRENVYLNGSILGMKRAEIDRKFDEIVAFAEVEKFLDTQVKRYSSGMYVRLAFAVAAHLEPEILIVDEVLAVGDAQFQTKCLGKMRDVAEHDGRTVLFVSHNMAAVRSLCNRALYVSEGTADHIGEVQTVIARYFDLSRKHPAGISLVGPDFRVLNIEIRNESDNHIFTFDQVLIRLVFQSLMACRVIIHITIEDDAGNLVCGLNSLDFCTHSAEPGKTYACCFSINSLPLNPGKYFLRVLFRNDTAFKNWDVPELLEFDVLPGSAYGCKIPTREWYGTLAVAANVMFHGHGPPY